ncbi:NUDIX domain-containing protein [Microlunatus sp. Y2014]|uniref:NUDIX domain-containing protein n=1 Tax=Microlunatus sp. Y2014 TaxID=3418488 RepID=UPI003DA744A7
MLDSSTSDSVLFTSQHVTYASADICFEVGPPPEELVSRIHAVALCRGEVVVCCTDEGWRFLPGGTREPLDKLEERGGLEGRGGLEPIEQNLDRELLEEAGARRTGPWSYLGAFRADHTNDRPYRPHLPHPLAFWAIVVTEVELVGPPTNPPDGEQVTAVHTFPPAEAIDFLAEHDRLHADVVRLAIAMGAI